MVQAGVDKKGETISRITRAKRAGGLVKEVKYLS
jgi:hypothetical protein